MTQIAMTIMKIIICQKLVKWEKQQLQYLSLPINNQNQLHSYEIKQN